MSPVTPTASCSGQRIERVAGCSTGGNARKAGSVNAMATTVSGMIERKAHRHPRVLAIRAPYDGPSRPGTIQAPASRASTRARPDSG